MIAFFLALHYWIRGLDSNSVDWIEPCYSSEKKRKERRDEAKLWLQRYAKRLKLGMITIWIPGCNIFIFNQPLLYFTKIIWRPHVHFSFFSTFFQFLCSWKFFELGPEINFFKRTNLTIQLGWTRVKIETLFWVILHSWKILINSPII